MATCVLVTGGAGFIGSHFIRHLLAREEEDLRIVNLDALTYAGNLQNLQDIEGDRRYTFVRADIGNPDDVLPLFKENKPQIVVNFAAESHVDRSILFAHDFIQTNIVGTHNLIEVSMKFLVECFCQVSTDEVYGSLGPEDPAFTETTPLAPSSPYSASKAAADHIVLSYVRTYGFPALITRCSNNYGPYQFPEKFIPLFVTNALDDKACPLYGDGSNVRDWIHVLDHCEGIWAAIRKGRLGEVYNFGGYSEWCNADIAANLMKLLNKPQSLIERVTDRLGHDRRYAMNCAKAEKELGWHPRRDFEQELAETVAWYTSNRSWWEVIKSGEYRAGSC